MSRSWHVPTEPADVDLIRDIDGQLWQKCRSFGWQRVKTYKEAGLNHTGRSWEALLGTYGPVAEAGMSDDD